MTKLGRPYRSLFLLLTLSMATACGDDTPPDPECAEDEDCPADQKCTEAGVCLAGVECTKDDDCLAKDPRSRCNTETFSCELVPPFADECDGDRPCAFGQFCSELLGRCLDSGSSRDCARRSQCPAGQICDRSANKCIEDPGCYGDQFCEDGEICDLVSHDCSTLSVECEPCASDNTCEGTLLCSLDTIECLDSGQEPICRPSEFCDILGRCVQCSNNDDCGPGLFCNSSLGRCESNVQCVDDLVDCPDTQNVQCITCDAPAVCDPRTRRCQAPPTECEDDLDCSESDFCDLSLPVPICIPRVPDCLNDLLGEPNNSSGLAATLEDAAGPLYDELKLCPGDEDWYRIDLDAGTYLTVDARFHHDEGDIELQLFLADGRTLLDESRSATDNERVEIEAGTDQTVYLRVFLAVPALVPPEYRLVVAKETGAVCADDGHEDDDILAQAVEIETDQPYEGRVCAGDPDWFVIRNVEAGSQLRAQLDFQDSLGDLDLELYRAGSSSPLVRSFSVTDDEELVYNASFSGDYFYRVLGKQADSNVYTLRIEVREGLGGMCIDDAFEPNDDHLEATRFPDDTGPSPSDLSICTGDEDWYAIALDAFDTVRAEIGFAPTADLELKLYAPGAGSDTASPIRQSVGTSLREFLAYQAPTAGDYLLRVQGLDQEQASPYDLFVFRDPPTLCEDDAIDVAGQGNTSATAYEFGASPGRVDDVTICNFDEDWYRVQLVAGMRHIIRIHYVDALATLDFALHDINGTQLIATLGEQGFDSKEIAVNVPGQGIFVGFVRVFQNDGFGAPYSLTADIAPFFACAPDRFEPNSFVTIATQTASSAAGAPYGFDDLSVCTTDRGPLGSGAGDEDWFMLAPPVAGTRMTAQIEHDQGDLLLELYSPGGAVRACVNNGNERCFSDGNGLNEMVSFTATVAAPYFLRVGSIYSNPAIVNPPLDADTRYRLDIDYASP